MGATLADSGSSTLPSEDFVSKTMDRLEALLRQKGSVSAHRSAGRGGCGAAHLAADPAAHLWKPRARTLLMQAVPLSALDLPLNALVWEDQDGRTRVSYDGPHYLQRSC